MKSLSLFASPFVSLLSLPSSVSPPQSPLFSLPSSVSARTWLAEMQAMVTVCAGMRSEKLASSMASRATLEVRD